MELLGEVEEHLRALSVEARKNRQLSGVREAAERGTLKLRGLKTDFAGYLRKIRKAEEQGLPKPPPFSFQNQDLLQPFLLACNYSDVGARLTLLALGSIQHLINRDALHPADGPNVMRVLAIQANSGSSDVHLRVLQSSLLLLSSKSCDMTEELLSQALLMCFSLSQARDATVRNAATATVRQIISMLFDKVQNVAQTAKVRAEETAEALHDFLAAHHKGGEDEEAAAAGEGGGRGSGATTPGEEACAAAGIPPTSPATIDGADYDDAQTTNPPTPLQLFERKRAALEREAEDAAALLESAGLSGVGRCAYLVFQDLCVLSRGEQGVWLKRTSVPPAMGLELVDQILSQQPRLFHDDSMFATLVSRQVCPLLLQVRGLVCVCVCVCVGGSVCWKVLLFFFVFLSLLLSLF